MKYICQSQDGTWQFGDYFEHLGSIKTRTPSHLLGLIHDQDRYRLDSAKSFHDAWLQKFTIYGPSETADNEMFRIEACFLGPMHDRKLKLSYRTVVSYKITFNPIMPGDVRSETIPHQDDLLVHEFDILADGVIEHRLGFRSGLEILIACKDLAFDEEMIPETRTSEDMA